MRLKETLKKNSYIVKLYVLVVTDFHRIRKFLRNRMGRSFWILTHKTRFSYGKANEDKIYCVIGRSTSYAGITSTVMYMLSDIYQATKKGYIPVIDFTDVHTPLWRDESRYGLDNSWELYFEQPIQGETLETVYKSKHVIRLIDCPQPWDTPDWQKFWEWSQKNVAFYYETKPSG